MPIHFEKSFTQAAENFASSIPALTIKLLDEEVVADRQAQWPKMLGSKQQWNWKNIHADLSDPHLPHKNFGLAFYVKRELCALASCYADPPKAGAEASVDIYIVEASPKPTHPLKGKVIRAVDVIATTLAKNNSIPIIRGHRPLFSLHNLAKKRGGTFKGTSHVDNFFEKRIALG